MSLFYIKSISHNNKNFDCDFIKYKDIHNALH